MSSVNKAILIGRLGQDPEIKYLQDGTAVANCSIATSEKWKDKSGETQERTEWHSLVFWKRTAEIVHEYVKKGDLIYAEGRLQTRSWDDQSGQKRYKTEIVVDKLQMLSSKGSSAGGTGGGQPAQSRSQAQSPATSSAGAPAGFDDFDDNIPF